MLCLFRWYASMNFNWGKYKEFLLERYWKTIVPCFLQTEPLLKYQTTGLTWDKEHCSLQVEPRGAGTRYQSIYTCFRLCYAVYKCGPVFARRISQKDCIRGNGDFLQKIVLGQQDVPNPPSHPSTAWKRENSMSNINPNGCCSCENCNEPLRKFSYCLHGHMPSVRMIFMGHHHRRVRGSYDLLSIVGKQIASPRRPHHSICIHA